MDWIKEGEREKKEERREDRYHQFWWSIWYGVQVPGGTHTRASWGYSLIDKSSLAWRFLILYGNYLACTDNLFFLTFLEMGRRALKIFSGLDSPYNPCLSLSLIPALVLYCNNLQEPEQGHLSQKCTASTCLWSPSHILLFLTVNYYQYPWMTPQLFGCWCLRHPINPLSSVILWLI